MLYLKGIADGEAHKAGVDAETQLILEVALDGCKQCSKQDDEVTDKLQADGQPSGGD